MACWRKLGRIYEPRPLHPKLNSHAANPLSISLGGDRFRIFYSGRDEQNRSSVGYIDFDIVSNKVLYVHDKPVFEHGPEGSFYSHGISLGNTYEANGRRYVLFMGWQAPPDSHWRGDIGRFLLEADDQFVLAEDKPFVGSSAIDPVSLSYPWVAPQQNGLFRMWYGSTVAWDAGNKEMLHVVNYADSADGERWDFRGLGVPFILGTAQAFSRPTVLGNPNKGYRMWFSYRGAPGKTYRIGHAISQDGEAWCLRNEDAGIDVSPDGWDSEMIEYPYVFSHSGRTYMLYNGNGYGKTGFGLAVLED